MKFYSFVLGWRKNQSDLKHIYSMLEVYPGGLPGHSTPTVVNVDEKPVFGASSPTSGRSRPSATVPSHFVRLENLI